jgi:hypothetical protein
MEKASLLLASRSLRLKTNENAARSDMLDSANIAMESRA